MFVLHIIFVVRWKNCSLWVTALNKFTLTAWPEGMCRVLGPGLPMNRFWSLMLANVPLVITASFPLRAPYELNSRGVRLREIFKVRGKHVWICAAKKQKYRLVVVALCRPVTLQFTSMSVQIPIIYEWRFRRSYYKEVEVQRTEGKSFITWCNKCLNK